MKLSRLNTLEKTQKNIKLNLVLEVEKEPKKILLTFGGRCSRYFWDIQLKSLSLPNFNMLFQLVLTKFFKVNCFRVYLKLIS